MLEQEKKKVAVYEGDIMAFNYQSTSCTEVFITEPIPEEWLSEEIFWNNIPRFYVVDGVVHRRTDEECEAYKPDVIKEIKKRELRAKFEDVVNGTDSMMYDFIEYLADKYKAEYPKAKEWLDKKQIIRFDVEEKKDYNVTEEK